jgi:hypothetical protein
MGDMVRCVREEGVFTVLFGVFVLVLILGGCVCRF